MVRSLGRICTGAALVVSLVACSGGDDGAADDAGPGSTTADAVSPGTSVTTVAPPTTPAPTSTLSPLSDPDPATLAELEATIGTAPGCEVLDGARCLLPYPSDAFTADDPSTDTGRRVSFPAGAAPANASGVPIDLTEWNRNDGFSPNSTLLTFVPGLDAAGSGLPSWTDPEA